MLKNPRNFHRSQNTSGHLSYSCFFSIKPCLMMLEMVLKTGRRNENVHIKAQCMYVRMHICMFAASFLQNGWTDLVNSFFVSSILVTGWFKAKKKITFPARFEGG